MTTQTAARIVFAGTPDFALATLKALTSCGISPVAVLTQPDRKAGRGRKLVASPVKRYAESLDIKVWQPATLKGTEVAQALSALRPDLMVVAAYGLIVPPSILAVPRKGCLNVHASLLPRWRGAAPIQAAILAGDSESGISLMQMDAGLDTGPVYVRQTTPISDQTTGGALHDTLAALGGSMVCEHLPAILAGELEAVAQDASGATYAGKIKTDDARIDWTQPVGDIDRVVRAFNPVPGARFQFADEWIKCWQARPSAAAVAAEPGHVVSIDHSGIDVACGTGSLKLERLQRPGRRPVSAAEFAAQLPVANERFT